MLDRPEFSRTGKYGAFIGRVAFFGSPVYSARADKIYVATSFYGPDPVCLASSEIRSAYAISCITGRSQINNIEFVRTNYANPLNVHAFNMGYVEPFDKEMKMR